VSEIVLVLVLVATATGALSLVVASS
jgi:hypothetical protein